MSASSIESSTINGTVKATINGHGVRIMIDTGASSSYICSDLVTTLSLKTIRKETRCIEQMYGTITRRVEIYEIKIKSTAVEGFSFIVNCINAEKGVLTCLPNPRVKTRNRNSSDSEGWIFVMRKHWIRSFQCT